MTYGVGGGGEEDNIKDCQHPSHHGHFTSIHASPTPTEQNLRILTHPGTLDVQLTDWCSGPAADETWWDVLQFNTG